MIPPQRYIGLGVLIAEDIRSGGPQCRQPVPWDGWKCVVLIVISGVEQDEVEQPVVRECGALEIVALMLTEGLTEIGNTKLP